MPSGIATMTDSPGHGLLSHSDMRRQPGLPLGFVLPKLASCEHAVLAGQDGLIAPGISDQIALQPATTPAKYATRPLSDRRGSSERH